MKQIGKDLSTENNFLKREDFKKEILRKLEAVKSKIKEGGGKKAIEKHNCNSE